MTNGTGMLEVLLHGEPIADIEIGRGPVLHEQQVKWVGEPEKLSLSLRQEPSAETLRRWLDNLGPEGETNSVFRDRAERFLRNEGMEAAGEPDVAARLWGNADREYPGAVAFRAWSDAAKPVQWERSEAKIYDEENLVKRLRKARLEAGYGRHRLVWEPRYGETVLCGVRGKIGLHVEGEVEEKVYRSTQPEEGVFSTHIFKLEDSEENLGEAAVESFVQTVLENAGIRAAKTWARVIGEDGWQIVISERSDRVNREGRITPRHQEDWAQASGLGKREKFGYQKEQPKLEDLSVLVRENGGHYEAVQTFNGIVACVLVGHSDLHRKNAGVLYAEGTGDLKIAPWYDVASGSGRDRAYTRWLAVPLGDVVDPDRVGEKEVLQLGAKAGLEREETLERAKKLGDSVERSIETAARKCAAKDEVGERHRKAAQKRIDRIRGDVQRRNFAIQTL